MINFGSNKVRLFMGNKIVRNAYLGNNMVYSTKIKRTMTGEELNSYSYGGGIATTDGYFLFNGQYCDAKKVQGITGNIIEVTGVYPVGSYGGSAVITTDGLFRVSTSGYASKVEGITGEMTSISGGYPFYGSNNNYGIVVGTTEGCFVIGSSNINPTKIKGITGKVISVKGDFPNNESHGFIAQTTDGCFIANNYGIVRKVIGLSGEVIQIDATGPLRYGSVVITTDGFFRVSTNGYASKVEGITGEMLYLVGTEPYSTDYIRMIVATTEGIFYISGNGVATKKWDLKNTIAFYGALPDSPREGGICIWTTDGVYLNGNKINGIQGDILYVYATPYNSTERIIIATTEGFFIKNSTHNFEKITNITGEPLV